jgi:hypothetical protein
MAGGKARAASDATLALETGASRWLALLTTLPTTEAGVSLVEVSDTGYVRVAVTAVTDWGAVTTAADNLTRQVSISAAKSFVAAVAGYTVKGWALYDAASAGTLRRWGPLVDGSGVPLAAGQAVASGSTFSFAANTVKISES